MAVPILSWRQTAMSATRKRLGAIWTRILVNTRRDAQCGPPLTQKMREGQLQVAVWQFAHIPLHDLAVQIFAVRPVEVVAQILGYIHQ